MMMMSAFKASRLRAVSLSVSPFLSDEASAVKLMMSALSRIAASSKLIRVRVEGSMKRLTTVLPRSTGTFLMARSPTALKARAVSWTMLISSGESVSMSSKCLRCQVIFSILLSSFSFFFQIDHVRPALLLQLDVDLLGRGSRHILAHEVRFDGQFTMTAIDQDSQLNAARAAKIIERIHGRAGGASAKEHIIYQHHRAIVEVERHNSRVYLRHRLLPDVVAVHANIQAAHRDRMSPDILQDLAQPLAEENPAALHPHNHD